jgi:hypothetical protein
MDNLILRQNYESTVKNFQKFCNGKDPGLGKNSPDPLHWF